MNKGADPFIRTHDGQTALELAVLGEHPEIVRLLIQAGCKPGDVEPATMPLIVTAVGKKKDGDSEPILKFMVGPLFRPFVRLANAIMDATFKSAESEATRETIKALLSGGASLEQKIG